MKMLNFFITTKILPIISVILGILGIISAHFYFRSPKWQGVPFYIYTFLLISIAGLFLGIISTLKVKLKNKKWSKVGIILSIISIFLWFIAWFFYVGLSRMQ